MVNDVILRGLDLVEHFFSFCGTDLIIGDVILAEPKGSPIFSSAGNFDQAKIYSPCRNQAKNRRRARVFSSYTPSTFDGPDV